MAVPRGRRFLFAALYLLFLAALVEGTARMLFGVTRLSDRISVQDSYGWRRAWVKQRRERDEQIYFAFDTFDLTKGWRSKAGIRNMKVFREGKILNTNAEGFRGARDFSLQKDSGKTRIVLIGDSFTFGEIVSDDESFAALLQREFPNTEILNLGIHGYGHDQMLIHLRESGLRYHPDIVILGYIAADQSRNLVDFRSYAKPRFVLDGDSLRLTGTPVPTPEETLRTDWMRPRTIDLLSTIRYMAQGPARRRAAGQRITDAILRQMTQEIQKAGATPVFAYLANGKENAGKAPLNDDERWFNGLCQRLPAVHCLSTRPYFDQKVAAGQTFKLKGHWDPAGHVVVAEAIGRFLADSLHVQH
jgi:lysophospholipase L1-like esterase